MSVILYLILGPEVILNKGQSFPTDWWAFGILLF
jgi:hypothetical protein